eukprot:g13289.t1
MIGSTWLSQTYKRDRRSRGVLTAAFLLLARGTGPEALIPCTFPLEGPLSISDFQASACNPGAAAGLIPFLETAILLIIPLFFSTVTAVARPVLLLLLLISYGTVGASVLFLSLQVGIQPENILFFIISLTFVLPIMFYEAELASNFLHVVANTRTMVRLYAHTCSLKKHAQYNQVCKQEERQQQWQEALQRAYEVVVEEVFKNSASSSSGDLGLTMQRMSLGAEVSLGKSEELLGAVALAMPKDSQPVRRKSLSLSNYTQYRAAIDDRAKAEMRNQHSNKLSRESSPDHAVKHIVRANSVKYAVNVQKDALENKRMKEKPELKSTLDHSPKSLTPEMVVRNIQDRFYGEASPREDTSNNGLTFARKNPLEDARSSSEHVSLHITPRASPRLPLRPIAPVAFHVTPQPTSGVAPLPAPVLPDPVASGLIGIVETTPKLGPRASLSAAALEKRGSPLACSVQSAWWTPESSSFTRVRPSKMAEPPLSRSVPEIATVNLAPSKVNPFPRGKSHPTILPISVPAHFDDFPVAVLSVHAESVPKMAQTVSDAGSGSHETVPVLSVSTGYLGDFCPSQHEKFVV